MITVLLRVGFDALLGASAVGLYLFCIRPQLLWRRGRWPAFAIAASLAGALPLVLGLRLWWEIPSYVVTVLFVLLLLLWFWPAAFVRLIGGPKPYSADLQPVVSGVMRAWEHFEVGDLENARREIVGLEPSRTPRTARYVDLWQRLIDEEAARRSGRHESSRETWREIQAEGGELVGSGRRIGILLTSLLLAIGAILGAVPAVADARACVGVELLLFAQTPEGPARLFPPTNVLIQAPEPATEIIDARNMDLEAAADSRSDPNTRAELLDSGFVGAYERAWVASDGRDISADVFEFRDADGALSYHRAVNRYACQYANEAFAGPEGGIGLQIRRSRGEPFVEQISMVVGSRRFVVSVGALSPPANHKRVLRLAERQADLALH